MEKTEEIKLFLQRSYKKINGALEKDKYNDALRIIKATAKIEYESNQNYVDLELEQALVEISKCYKQPQKGTTNAESVMFIDGFGLNNRGLAYIYLKALVTRYKVNYVTFEKNINNIPDIKSLVLENNGLVDFIQYGSRITQGEALSALIIQSRASKVFIYTKPDDVIVCSVLPTFEGVVERIKINLTDHAFWLGTRSIDKILEFRNYGIYLTKHHRKIDADKIFFLPFYPQMPQKVEFQGFPFENKGQKVVFSGGDLRKTIGGNDEYYRFVEWLLNRFDDLVFWYAGGSKKYKARLDKLVKDYPGRVFWTSERKDLTAVLKKSNLFLNTYPIGGGLLVQYAVLAGTIPIMVRYDDNSSGVLINQERLTIFHDSFESAKVTVEKVLSDEKYRNELLEELSGTVIDEREFNTRLYDIIDGVAQCFQHDIPNVDNSAQKEAYINSFNSKNLERYYITHDDLSFLFFHPIILLKGIVGYSTEKIKKRK